MMILQDQDGVSTSFISTNLEFLRSSLTWMQLKSPCFSEKVSIILQLGFIGIILLHFLQKILSKTSRNINISDQQAAKSYPNIVAKLSLSYTTSTVCSTLMLSIHVLNLLMLILNGMNDTLHCNSQLEAYSSQIVPMIPWAVTIILLLKIKQIRFPCTLRAWWAFSFFLSIVDTYYKTTEHDDLKMLDYANFISLLASFILLIISIRGNTGLVFIINSTTIVEPLVSGKTTDKDSDTKRGSLYGRATLLQLITFSWLNPLFSGGINKPLEQDDIPDVDVNDSAEFVSFAFYQNLKQVREKDNGSMYKAMFLFIRQKAAINAMFAMINAGASYVGPYLIHDFVNFLAQPERDMKSGYLLALAFLGAKMVETIAQRRWMFGSRQLGLRLRAALISYIYNKGLVLSSPSRQSHTIGEIINYMSVDVQRITDFIWYLNIIFMLPVQISLAITILHTSLGLGYVAALAATLTVMSCNIPITRIQKRYQSRIMDAKDKRMQATSEVIRNMKTIKLQAWDSQFLHKLESLRNVEYKWLWKSLRLSATSTFIFWGSPTFISVVTFGACMLMGIQLTAGSVLSALATIRILQDPIFKLPDLLSVIAQAKVSADRVGSYLQEDEIEKDAVEHVHRDETNFDVEVENGKFSWDSKLTDPTLDGVQLKVKRGMKVAICGTVGSGKSSLLSSILGEMVKLSGTVKISGTKASVPQSPWILTGSIRDNILFGNPYDKNKYDRTVKACALTKDFEQFACGDLMEIGERGINMSGGQKQRIQIARAVYQDADIYLLDDPFSAVDPHTATHLFEDCLMGILKKKTVLYVTHQVEFLPSADIILVMQNGRIAQGGRFKELVKQNIGFEVLVGAHKAALQSVLSTVEKNPSKTCLYSGCDGESNSELLQQKNGLEHNRALEITETKGKLVKDEEREKGSIGKEVYWSYLTTVKGGVLIPVILLAQSSFQVLQISSNYWMAWASPPTTETEPTFGMNFVLLVYSLLAVGSSVCVLVRTMLVAVAGLWTAQTFFINMLHSVLRAPMAFFDSTPAGRILNRASTDQSVLDLELAIKLGPCAFSIIQILGTIAVMSQVAWEVFVIFIPVTAICIWYQQYYIPTARELARLAGIQRAPILHHFAESIAGAATIRAFDQEKHFTDVNLGLIDNHSRPWFHNVSAMEWLSFRLNLLSNFVFAFSLLALVTLPEGTINPSLAGLAVTYGINLNVLQAAVIWNICNAENKMISVERILQYSNLACESALEIEECRPPNNWPEVGTICFRKLEIRYAEHLPSVLKNISCTFPGRKKIGVVGRTGSGKSTLIQAIFRIVEPREGSIIIDDVDISRIGLHDLRSRLSIIPQDPTMFEGTVRGNLDPLVQYSDNQVWEALDKCQLGEIVCSKEEKLDATVIENGENWSVGQRQLLCLGRALLKKSRMLVLDEATASVDSGTDGVIQKIIDQEFKGRTVVTIAHRIHTVIHSDFILVLSDGRVAEFETPAKLLEQEDSLFSKLIKEYSMRSKTFQ